MPGNNEVNESLSMYNLFKNRKAWYYLILAMAIGLIILAAIRNVAVAEVITIYNDELNTTAVEFPSFQNIDGLRLSLITENQPTKLDVSLLKIQYAVDNIVIFEHDILGTEVAIYKTNNEVKMVVNEAILNNFWNKYTKVASKVILRFKKHHASKIINRIELDIFGMSHNYKELKKITKRNETNNPSKAITDSKYDSPICHVSNKNGWQYTWENENLIKAVKNEIAFEAQYDTLGRRIRKKIFKNGLLIKNQAFSYDGNNLSAIYDLMNNSKIPTVTFSWKESTSSLLYSMEKDYKTYYYVIDNSNNVIALVDYEGKSVAQYAYGPMGDLLEKSGSVSEDNPFGFNCGFYDEETGLLLIDKKYYNPDTATWLTK